MPLKKERHADYLGRAEYARARAAAARDRREAKDWLVIASEWEAVADAMKGRDERGSPPAQPEAPA